MTYYIRVHNTVKNTQSDIRTNLLTASMFQIFVLKYTVSRGNVCLKRLAGNHLLPSHKITTTDLLCRGLDTSCSGNGVYQHETCSCVCNPGWEGPDCSVSSCPDECNDNGRCVDNRCVCHQGYTGDDCSLLACPGDCSDKGHCVDGRCVCFPHFTGEDCSTQKCPNDCAGHGRCVDGQCVCGEGLYGEDCSSGRPLTFFPDHTSPG